MKKGELLTKKAGKKKEPIEVLDEAEEYIQNAIQNPELARFYQQLQLQGYSRNTQYYYLMWTKLLLKDYLPEELTQENVDTFFLSHKSKRTDQIPSVVKASIRNYLAFRNLQNITIPKLKGRQAETELKYLTDNEVKIVLKYLPEKEGLFCRLLSDTGLRISSALNLSFSDINFKTLKGRIMSKGGTLVDFVITPELAKDIRVLFKGDIDSKIFRFDKGRKHLNYILRRFKKLIGRSVSPHMFRHSFFTRLRRNGFDLDEIQKIAHHKSISTTQRYAKIDDFKVENKLRSFLKTPLLEKESQEGVEEFDDDNI